MCSKHHFHDGVCCNCSAPSPVKILHDAFPHTQKAIGVRTLDALGLKVPAARLVASDADLEQLATEVFKPQFVRPCPPTPRPGFVDSKICTTVDEIRKVWQAARKAEPTAEMLLMPPIKAKLNACMTQGLLTVGPGHDGATAGNNALGFPLASVDPLIQKNLVKLGIKKDEVPHVEAVWDGTNNGMYNNQFNWWWTQCRSGPAHPGGGPNFIPYTLTVTNIVLPCDDLMEWEHLCKQGFPAGTVVDGSGHTLGSHAALHCITHEIPFITSYHPQIGEELIPTKQPAYDVEAVRHGVGIGMQASQEFLYGVSGHGHDHINTILYGLHHAAEMRGAEGYWVGLAAALMWRFGYAAADVELSIYHPEQAWSKGKKESNADYKEVLHANRFPQYYDNLNPMIEWFFTDFHGSGVGGWKWGQCAFSLWTLSQALRNLWSPHAGKAQVLALISSLNDAVDQVHNGGYWMNKYGSCQKEFQAFSDGSWQSVLQNVPTLLKWKARQTQDSAFGQALWSSATPLSLPAFSITKANLEGSVLEIDWWIGTHPRHTCWGKSGHAWPPNVTHKINTAGILHPVYVSSPKLIVISLQNDDQVEHGTITFSLQRQRGNA